MSAIAETSVQSFDSTRPLEEIKDSHTHLLKRQSSATRDGAGAHDRNLGSDIQTFIRRAIASGGVLESASERREAQSLIDYWVTRLIRFDDHPSTDGLDVLEGETLLAPFDEAQAPNLPDEPCPYPGLSAFREKDDSFFFGRNQLIDEMIGHLRLGQRMLAVIGSSGSGKSSVVLAGLLARLRADALPDSATWRYATLVPGTNPLGHLHSVITAHDVPPPFVIVVDQFEELFTLTANDEARVQFANELAGLIESPDPRHIVIITLRSDYTEQMARLPALVRHYRAGRVDVEAMDASELREAIEQPARKVGLVFAEGIVDDMIDKIRGERAGLPLLQFALRQLWKHRRHNRITRALYEQVGNPLEALNRSANDFYSGQITQNQEAIRRLLLKMVRPTDGDEFTSKRIPRAQAFVGNVNADTVERMLTALIREGLVKETKGASEADTQIEVAHEALVRNWKVLLGWLEEERDTLRDRQVLAHTADQWLRTGRDANVLIRGKRLEEAEHFADLTADETAFVQASQAAADAAAQASEQARNRELMYAQEQATTRRLRILVTALVVIALTAAGTAGWAFAAEQRASAARQQAEQKNQEAEAAKSLAEQRQQEADAAKNQLEQQNQIIQSRQLAGIASKWLRRDPALALAVALEAEQGQHTYESEDALRQALASMMVPTAVFGHALPVQNAQFSRDGQLIVTSGDEDIARVWDAVTRTVRFTLKGHAGPVNSARFSPDGKQIVTTGFDKTIRLWDVVKQGSLIAQFSTVEGVNDARFSPDGKQIISNGADGNVHIWDVRTRKEIASLIKTDFPVLFAQFSPDRSKILTVGEDGDVFLWNAKTGRPIKPFEGHSGAIHEAQFSPDGGLIVTASDDETARVWEMDSGKLIAIFPHGSPVLSAQFSHNGKTIVTGATDGAVRVWDITLNYSEPVTPFARHDDAVNGVAFSPDGSSILTASDDRTVRLWPVTRMSGLNSDEVIDMAVTEAAFSPDGKRVVSIVASNRARLWDVDSGRVIADLVGHEDAINNVLFSPDGKRIATSSNDTTVRLWNGESGEFIDALKDHEDAVIGTVFVNGSKRILTWSKDNTAIVWNGQNLSKVATLSGHTDAVLNAWASLDGKRILTLSADETARLWDGETGKRISDLDLNERNEVITSAQLSPDGKRIVTGSGDGVIRVWDSDSGALVTTFTGRSSAITVLQFSPDGQRIVAVGEDRLAWVWAVSAGSGQPLATLTGHEDIVVAAQFSPDNKIIATTSADGKVRLWDAGANMGRLISELGSDEGNLESAEFSPDGKHLVTRQSDGKALLWQMTQLKDPVAVLGGNGPVYEALFSPNGKRVITGRDGARLSLYWVLIEDVVRQAQDLNLDPLTCPERVKFLREEKVNCEKAGQ